MNHRLKNKKNTGNYKDACKYKIILNTDKPNVISLLKEFDIELH